MGLGRKICIAPYGTKTTNTAVKGVITDFVYFAF